jgi:branched-chain amino acid transport system ATP-binding protein
MVLLVHGLSVGYGAVPVLDGVSLEVEQRKVLAVLGRNGAGKTTLLRALAGLLKPASGRMEYEGRDIARLPPHQIARLGIAYVQQGRGILTKLTVEENLIIGTRARTRRGGRIPDSVFDYFPILKARLRQRGGTLSGGEQQQLALGRALCGNPRLLLLDEPSEGLQPTIVQLIGQLIPRFASDDGMAVLLVEQNLDLALTVATKCLILDKGRIAYEADRAQLEQSEIMEEFLAV